jgi:hypothetical protein
MAHTVEKPATRSPSSEGEKDRADEMSVTLNTEARSIRNLGRYGSFNRKAVDNLAKREYPYVSPRDRSLAMVILNVSAHSCLL